jgi:glycine cleavage system H protein
MSEAPATLSFQRAKFRTRLPLDRLYTPGHMWLREGEPGRWEVGLTRFALRMLGEPVELDLEVAPDAPVTTGEVVGWVEGFKAVSDLYSPLDGSFGGGNPVLQADVARLKSAPYGDGWLFAVRGEPGTDCVDGEGYASFLEATIDRMLGEAG